MRRKFWEIVKKYKADRYTILTTHYMDEAEELGDKICVLNAGRVYCEGTPLSLKAKFATGVNLTLQIN
jgi:ABC-type multidrug transport system ATPase subunit